MKKACFITGTDTGVGKTTIAASLAMGFKKVGIRVGVMKPVETGCEPRGKALVCRDAICLRKAASFDVPLELINPYSFAPPLSPGLAARQEGREIDFDLIRAAYEEIRKKSDVIIVEGAGGLLAPLGEDETGVRTMADLASYLKIPLLIVAHSRLGVINQCMLTVSVARQMGLSIMGIVLNQPSRPDSEDMSLESNVEEVEINTGEEVLGEISYAKKKAPYVDVRGLIKHLISGKFSRASLRGPA